VTARVEPSNVKLPLSSSSPPDPTITTRLFVRSSIIAVLAAIPASTLTKPLNVDTPVTLRLPIPAPVLSRLLIDAIPRRFKLVLRTKSSEISISPVTLRLPPTVTIPAKAAFPLTAKVIAAPTAKPPLAVTIPAAAMLPLV